MMYQLQKQIIINITINILNLFNFLGDKPILLNLDLNMDL